MKKHLISVTLCVLLVTIGAAAAFAGEQPASTDGTPAILASLGSQNATVLDDQSAMAVRGQDGTYLYVLVKILGVNALDYGSGGYSWTWNPLGFRYGNWGGPGWTNGGLTSGIAPTADQMDYFFMLHDQAYDGGVDKLIADAALVTGLTLLPYGVHGEYSGTWGRIYVTDPLGLPAGTTVRVSGVSLIGNRFFFGWKSMPYSEYARREALAGMTLMVAGRAILRLQ